MPITYDDIKHRLQPPLDCAEIKDLRGRYFHYRLIINYEDTDFTGCVLYRCYPSGLTGAIEISPAQSKDEVTLRRADLSGAELWDASLEGADLQEVDLSDADLWKASLEGANLREANLHGAFLRGAVLQGADLQGANLEGANLESANLEGANLYDANLGWGDLQGVNLQGANLQEAYLVKANLRGANLQGANLQEATLEGTRVYWAMYNSKTTLPATITQEQLRSMAFARDDED